MGVFVPMLGGAMIKTVSVYELSDQLDIDPESVLIDVRPAAEFRQGHVPQAHSIPLGSMAMGQLQAEWSRDAEGKPVFFICRSGEHSQQLLDELADAGFENAQCVAGGMAAWQAMGLPIERKHWVASAFLQNRRVCLITGLIVWLGCSLGFVVHPGFFAIPVLVAAEMIFVGLTGWSGFGAVLGRKDRLG